MIGGLTAGCTSLVVDAPSQENDADSVDRVAATVGDDPSSCETPDDADECAAGGAAFYRHPLQNVEPVDGLLPFIDVQRTPDGNVYAMMEAGRGTEDGDYEVLVSGVVELESRPMTAEELLEQQAPVESFVHDKLSPELREAIDLAIDADEMAGEPIDVIVHLDRQLDGTVTTRINRAIAEGLVLTQEDREVVREEIMDDLALDAAERLEPVLAVLEANDVTPHYVASRHPWFAAALPPALVVELSSRDDVSHLSTQTGGAVGAGSTGRQEAHGHQFRDFWDAASTCGLSTCDYDGENGVGTDIRVAVMDPEQFRASHYAFRDTSGASDRISGMWDCDGNSCDSVSGWDPPQGGHGTAVLGALIGDLRDGQDSGYTGTVGRERRSAAGGEAHAYLYEAGFADWAAGTSADVERVLDHASGLSPAPHLFVSSTGRPGNANDFGDCMGDLAIDDAVDTLFEDGIASFWLAGNDLENPGAEEPWDNNGISGDEDNCTVWEPGSAIGAFTVGAYDEDDGTVCSMRGGLFADESAWGGSTTDFDEGRFRSVIDITANWCADKTPLADADDDYGVFCGTSNAAPTAASAAIAFIDMWKQEHGNTIDDPGYLYAWMLNSADRQGIDGGYLKLNSEYDHRFGAGRLNLRMVSSEGMDGPWSWGHWEVCVDHGEVVTLTINGGTSLPGDVDSVRATAWWYDRRFNNGLGPDNINLRLKETDNTLLVQSNSFYDNKERVYYNDVGGLAIKLELHGATVQADNEGCGTNSMRVWVTLLYEDDDRDDGNGPTYNSTNCHGVQTL